MKNGKNLRRALVVLAAAGVPLALAGAAVASITIATVPVGNPGNAADPNTGSVYGSVNYCYNIGEYNVTSSQYTAFLNAVAATDTYDLYNSNMVWTTNGNPGIIQSGPSGSYTYSVTGGRGNYPVTEVTFWDAARFANWLANGQPSGPEGPGTTETGTYTLTSTGIANDTVTRNPGATWAVASQDEWYKAAYYSPTLNAGAGGYWLYPTQSNTISTTMANCDDAIGDTTPVGSYPYPSHYGTYDQGGDVWQWTDSIVYQNPGDNDMYGGAFDYSDQWLETSSGVSNTTTNQWSDIGFRVSLVPEPSSLGVLAIGLMGMLARRRGAGR